MTAEGAESATFSPLAATDNQNARGEDDGDGGGARFGDQGVDSVDKKVLLDNVGPPNFQNMSEICPKTVRKLSFSKNCQKTV